MKNPYEPITPFDKEVFAYTLKKAIGDRTQRDFALDSSVNHSYISKLLNGKLDTPPTPRTLKKIALAAGNHISYHDLLTAAGYRSESFSDFTNSPSTNFHKIKANIFELTEACKHIYATIFELSYPLQCSCTDILKKQLSLKLAGNVINCSTSAILSYQTKNTTLIDLWQFHYVTKASFLKEIGDLTTIDFNNLRDPDRSEIFHFCKPKISFVFTDEVEYHNALKNSFPVLSFPFSIILVNVEGTEEAQRILNEDYLKTAYTDDLNQLPTLAKPTSALVKKSLGIYREEGNS